MSSEKFDMSTLAPALTTQYQETLPTLTQEFNADGVITSALMDPPSEVLGFSVPSARNVQTTSCYMKMVIESHGMPLLYNLLAKFFTWVLLAGFVIVPGTFQSLADSTPKVPVPNSVQKIPLCAPSLTCFVCQLALTRTLAGTQLRYLVHVLRHRRGGYGLALVALQAQLHLDCGLYLSVSLIHVTTCST